MALQNLSSFHCAHAAPDFQICKTNDNCEEQLASAELHILGSLSSFHAVNSDICFTIGESVNLMNQSNIYPTNRIPGPFFLKEQSISLYGMSMVYGEALRDIEKSSYEGDWKPIG